MNTGAFDRETVLEPLEDGCWQGFVASAWNIGDNPNGGYLASLALAAVRKAVPHPHPVTVTTHFLRPGLADQPCQIAVEVLRTGRQLSTARAQLTQAGKARIELLCAFGDLAQPVGVDAEFTLPPPSLPAPEACTERSGETQGIHLPIMTRLDVRLHPRHARAGANDAAEMGGWIRFRDDRDPDTFALPLFVDAFPPTPLARLGVVGWVPTLELTVHVRRLPAPGWVQGWFHTDDLLGGRMVENGCLWDSTGQLVAQSRQLGLVMRQSD